MEYFPPDLPWETGKTGMATDRSGLEQVEQEQREMMDISAMIQEGLRLSNEWLRTHQAEIERIQREAFSASGLHFVYEEVNVVESSLIEPVTDPTRLLAATEGKQE